LSPGQIHELNLSDDIKGYIFLFTSAFYHVNKIDSYKLFELPFFYTLGKDTPPLLLKNHSERILLEELFQKAIAENDQRFADKEDAVRALLDLILIYCKRLYPEVVDDKMSKGKVLVKRFKQMIEKKCQENLSVKDYAQLLHVTPNYLSET